MNNFLLSVSRMYCTYWSSSLVYATTRNKHIIFIFNDPWIPLFKIVAQKSVHHAKIEEQEKEEEEKVHLFP